MIGITRELANFVTRTRYEDLPIDVVDRAKQLILDTVGMVLAGSRTEQGKMIIAFVKRIDGRKECTILGGERHCQKKNDGQDGLTDHSLMKTTYLG